MKSRGRAVAAVLLLVLVATIAPGRAVSASNFGSQAGPVLFGLTTGVWLTTNSTLLVGRVELTATYSNAVQSVMSSEYNPTDLSVIVESPASCWGGYDVCVFDLNFGDIGYHAWNSCAGTTSGSHPNQTCSVQYVRINLLFNPPANYVVCHEVGHSIGLRHSDDSASCMDEEGSSPVLTNHDKGHINARY